MASLCLRMRIPCNNWFSIYKHCSFLHKYSPIRQQYFHRYLDMFHQSMKGEPMIQFNENTFWHFESNFQIILIDWLIIINCHYWVVWIKEFCGSKMTYVYVSQKTMAWPELNWKNFDAMGTKIHNENIFVWDELFELFIL